MQGILLMLVGHFNGIVNFSHVAVTKIELVSNYNICLYWTGTTYATPLTMRNWEGYTTIAKSYNFTNLRDVGTVLFREEMHKKGREEEEQGHLTLRVEMILIL